MADQTTISSTAGNRRSRVTRPSSVPGNERSNMIGAAFGRITTILEERTEGQWRFRMPGMRRIAYASLSFDWLRIGVSLRTLQKPMDVSHVGATLSRNAQIQGIPRIIGCRQQRQRQLVADIPADLLPWHSQPEIEKLLSATISSLGAALNAELPQAALPRRPQLPNEQLEAMFDEAGWPSSSSEEDGLHVPLEVSGCYVAAKVGHDGSSTRLQVSNLVNERSQIPDACRGAVAVLLWLVASRVRMVKPTRFKRALALEVTLPPGVVSSATLAHSCAALSASMQQLVAEVEILIADEQLAQVYLSNLGFEITASRVSRDSSLTM